MARLRKLGRVDGPGGHGQVCDCDGVDERGQGEAALDGERIWFVLGGRFELTRSCGRVIADPATAILTRDREPYRVRHLGGGDRILTVGGAIAGALVDGARPAAPLSIAAVLALRALTHRMRAHAVDATDAVDGLELEETVCAAVDRPRPQPLSARRRRVADEVAHRIGLAFDRPLSLAALAAPHGLSVFALSRVFRQVHGEPVHRRHQRVRLAHALALVVDTRRSLAEIAATCGFASHAHLTASARRLAGTTPSDLRLRRK